MEVVSFLFTQIQKPFSLSTLLFLGCYSIYLLASENQKLRKENKELIELHERLSNRTWQEVRWSQEG